MKLKHIAKTLNTVLKMLPSTIVLNAKEKFNVNAYPQFLVFYTTFRCDSRCKACNVWKGNDTVKIRAELSIAQIGDIFSDPLFRKIKHINIQGGEATLREDLVEIVETAINKLPSLKKIALTSNGLDSDRVASYVRRVYKVCRENKVKLSVALSIDGVGKYHDFARGDEAFSHVTRTMECLSSMNELPGFNLATNCVLTAQNIDNIEEIVKFQREKFNSYNISIVEFREHFLNVPGSVESKMLLFSENPKEKRKLITYLKKHIYPSNFHDFMAFRHEQLRAMLEDDAQRIQSCQYKIAGLVLDHTGGLMLCPIGGHLGSCIENRPSSVYFSDRTRSLRRELSLGKCLMCFPYNFYIPERTKDLFKYLIFFLRSRMTTD